jgi:hypothetical protein
MRRIVCALILFSSVCSAQDYYMPRVSHRPNDGSRKDSSKKTATFISLDFGFSIPLRDFGNKDTARNFMIIGPDSTHAKGFANVGFHGSATGGIYITPTFGVCGKIGYNENTFDESTLNLLVNGAYSYTINGNYSIWQFMGGFFGNFQTRKNSWVWIQAMGGVINANFPSFSIYNLPTNLFPQYISWNFTLPNATDFAYSLSIGYEISLSQNVSFLSTLTYTGSELVYPSLTYDLSGPYYNLPPPYTQNTPVTMSFGSLDFSVGLLFHL